MKLLSGFGLASWPLFLVSLLLLSPNNNGNGNGNGVAADDKLVNWMRENGGIFSDSVEFRHLDPNDSSSPNGLFAKVPLKEKETIIMIPHKCLLVSPEDPPEELCGLARTLAEEHRIGDKSFYSDYINYLFDGSKKGRLPDRWSDEAKEIMDEILGDELPSPFSQRSYERDCGESDELEHELDRERELDRNLLEDSYELVVSRSWTEVMIPLYDMINHKNGHWRNVEATSAHTEEDITVFAFRDIEAGEQLFISYNECLDTDCEGLFYSYGTPEILGDYGFVEEYPQRWIWRSFPSLHDDNPPLVLEFDQVVSPDLYDPQNQAERLAVTWHTNARPDLQIINVMSGHLKSLEAIDAFVQESTHTLLSDHERHTIRRLYQSLVVALRYTIWSFYDEAIDDLGRPTSTQLTESDNNDDEWNIRHYDNLEKRPVIGNPEGAFLYVCHPIHERIGPDYELLFMEKSQYQEIEFRYGEEEDDTCLWLSGWGQTCSSFRQYHEALVHYPASFLPEVKRVVYIGGGDNMILHEILKYPSIELVLGLELDQEVVRYSFMNMGTLPYFDDPRVQWWFGDATKSLLMLPEDYFGSFDLVLVDLQTFVADALFVTENLSIMDTMKLLLKPNGIISKNEDFPNRKITDFAKYTVDMEYCDLPQICRQSITIGSNGINFLTAPQFNHDIQTIYMKESLEAQGRFNNWYDFRENNVEESSKPAIASQVGPGGATSSPQTNKNGILVVVEAEALSGTCKTRKEFVVALTMALGSNNIEVSKVDEWAEDENHFDVGLFFDQGYVLLRKRPVVDNYVAIDIALWDGIEKVNVLKKTLIERIGGVEQKSSSYRLVTGGIQGVGGEPFLANYVVQDDTCENLDTVDKKSKDINFVWSEFVNFIPGGAKSIVVLCGLQDSNCASWDALQASSVDAVALFTCDGISEQSFDKALFKCEAEMMKTIRESLSNKINGIWLDTKASKTMAKILLRLLTGQIGRAELLDNNSYTILTQLTAGEKWREVFLERFLTEVSPFSPAKEARLSFTKEVAFSFFSAGDETFYESLLKFMEDFEMKTQIRPTLETVASGHASYVPDFSPEFFNNQAYDNSKAYIQWNSQQPMGFQTVSQMELKAPKTPLKSGEEVLFQHDDHVWLGRWTEATVVGQNEDLSYVIETERFGSWESVTRDSLRRLDFDVSAVPFPTIDVGARVIYMKEGNSEWMQGFVVSRTEDGKEYQVREYDADGLILEVAAEDLMPQFEITHAEELPSLSPERLEKIFRKALAKSNGAENPQELYVQSHVIGDGCVINSFWRGGNAVLVWDGANHISTNFFLDYEDGQAAETFQSTFIEKIPFLASITRDEQPRGYGGVVNFGSEINRDEDPVWWHHEPNEDFNQDSDE